MKVHEMIRQFVPALSGCWQSDIPVLLPLGDLFVVEGN